MKKVVSILILILALSFIFQFSISTAGSVADPNAIISSMKGANEMASTDNSFGKMINTVIGFLQVAGTGIAIIVVSILGIKYLLASPSEKADTKKSIMPILIGCVLLFGAVNLIAIISEFTETFSN